MKKILIVSFPKSGNTLIRQFLISYNFLIKSSFDELIKKSYEINIFNYNKKINQNHQSLKVTKTHLPSRYIKLDNYYTILIVRNPLDSWWSLYNYQKSIHGKLFEYPKIFKFFRFLFTIENWLDFHKNWINKLNQKNKNNYIIVNYDLLQNDKINTLKKLVKNVYSEVDEKRFKYAIEQISLKKMQIAQNQSLMMKNKFDDKYIFASTDRPKNKKITKIKHLKLIKKKQIVFNFFDSQIYDYKHNYYLIYKIFIKYRLSKIIFWIYRKLNFNS